MKTATKERNDPERVRFADRALNESYEKVIHPSGLTVYVFPKRLTTQYALLATRYGSVDEDFYVAGENGDDGHAMHLPAGVAHFLEHKMFENEDGVDSAQRFSALGADANAYTTTNRTVYLFGCTENFDASLAELIRFVTHPYFPAESVEREKGIIAQEIKMYDDDPYERSFMELMNCLYEKNPVKINICGTVESIGKITPEMLYRSHRIFYHPSNMALVVCGDVTTEQVLAVVDKELSATPSRRIVRGVCDEPPEVYMPRADVKMPVSKPIFLIGFKDEGWRLDDAERLRRDAGMSILNEMLFSRAGRLYNALFESGKISPGLSYGYSVSSTFSFNSVGGEAEDPEAVLEDILAELARVRREGLSREDFERSRRVMLAEHVKNFDSTAEIANDLLSFAFDGGEIFTYGHLLSEVSFEDVTELLHTSMAPERVAMAVVHPADAAEDKEE